jgi:hypothetical protein
MSIKNYQLINSIKNVYYTEISQPVFETVEKGSIKEAAFLRQPLRANTNILNQNLKTRDALKTVPNWLN